MRHPIMTIDEGYTKFTVDWTRCDLAEFDEVAELCQWRKPLFDAGLIGFYSHIGVGFGNISMRIGTGTEFVISGTQTGHLAVVGPEHFALVTTADIPRNRVACSGAIQASSESMTHAVLYAVDAAINAVVHVHSERLWTKLHGVIPTTADDVAYGTPEMAAEFMRLYRESSLRSSGVAVMGGHDSGLISIGRSMAEAATRVLELAKNREPGSDFVV
jgi:ribulose-5-phosphate 4-epimerase/fuculose-1-phosphate aldolase